MAYIGVSPIDVQTTSFQVLRTQQRYLWRAYVCYSLHQWCFSSVCRGSLPVQGLPDPWWSRDTAGLQRLGV